MTDIDKVSFLLGDMKSSIDALHGIVQTSVNQQTAVNDKMERRLSKVESRVHFWSGGAAVIGTIIGFFVNSFGRH